MLQKLTAPLSEQLEIRLNPTLSCLQGFLHVLIGLFVLFACASNGSLIILLLVLRHETAQ